MDDVGSWFMAVCSSCDGDGLLHLVSNVDHDERVTPTRVLGRLSEAPRRDVVVLDYTFEKETWTRSSWGIDNVGRVAVSATMAALAETQGIRGLDLPMFCMLLWRTRGVLDSGEFGIYKTSRMTFPGGKACFSVEAFRSPDTVAQVSITLARSFGRGARSRRLHIFQIDIWCTLSKMHRVHTD